VKTASENTVLQQRSMQDELERLKAENNRLAASNREWEEAARHGLKKLDLEPEIEADVLSRMAAGLDRDMALKCALRQKLHNDKLAERQKQRLAVEEVAAQKRAKIAEDTAREQTVLQEFTRQILAQAKSAKKGAAAA